jgi:hypothetical protein
MNASKCLFLGAALLGAWRSAVADETITSIMSPLASYQYQENFSSAALTNGGVSSPVASYQYKENLSMAALVNGGLMSPVAAYQYYEWRGEGTLLLNASPTNSYYYQFTTDSIPGLLQPAILPGQVVLAWPLSWPFARQDFLLQTTTNLLDPNSWMTVATPPVLVNLQNTITNPMVGNQGYYRLIPAQ